MLGEQRGKSLDDVELTPAEKFLKVPPLLISLSLHQGSQLLKYRVMAPDALSIRFSIDNSLRSNPLVVQVVSNELLADPVGSDASLAVRQSDLSSVRCCSTVWHYRGGTSLVYYAENYLFLAVMGESVFIDNTQFAIVHLGWADPVVYGPCEVLHARSSARV